MKITFFRILAWLRTLFCAILFLVCTGCQYPANSGQETMNTTTQTEVPPKDSAVESIEKLTEEETLSAEKQLLMERQEYLAGVTYRHFVLTGEAKPYYMGRWFEKDIDGEAHMVTLTDGAHLYFLVENATSFDVNFTVITTMAEPYFAYSIDGGRPIRQHISQARVSLPDTGRHTVRIIADGMTENEGKWDLEKGLAIKSIVPSDGGNIAGIKPTEPVIFFYGDSITEGVRALNMSATSDGNSATNAYSWQCAEALGVTPYLIGYGASGIIMTGSFNTMMNAIDYLSEGRPVEDGVVPDIIVVNHGANDGGQDSVIFEEALMETLSHLRQKYPDAPIVYLIPFNQAHAAIIANVIPNIENAYVVETEQWKIRYTDGLHPNAVGAKAAGENLAAELKLLFGEEFFNP